MVYTTEYASPLGAITLACDEEAIIGLWFNGQRYFGNILPKRTEQKERPLFADAKRWLDIYFSGSRIFCRCCGMTPRRSAKRSARLC